MSTWVLVRVSQVRDLHGPRSKNEERNKTAGQVLRGVELSESEKLCREEAKWMVRKQDHQPYFLEILRAWYMCINSLSLCTKE